MTKNHISAIEVAGISKCFGSKRVLENFSAAFPCGAVSCIMGESGCGKSTLLNILMGLIKPDSGVITGLPLRISAVFQEDRLCEEFSVAANLRIAAAKGITAADIEAALTALGLVENLRTPVRDLSGGMKRRVAIARALLAEGSLLIMDEPFRGLDDITRRAAAAYVRKSLDGRTLIAVTHDAEDAELLGAVQVVRMRTLV